MRSLTTREELSVEASGSVTHAVLSSVAYCIELIPQANALDNEEASMSFEAEPGQEDLVEVGCLRRYLNMPRLLDITDEKFLVKRNAGPEVIRNFRTGRRRAYWLYLKQLRKTLRDLESDLPARILSGEVSAEDAITRKVVGRVSLLVLASCIPLHMAKIDWAGELAAEAIAAIITFAIKPLAPQVEYLASAA